MDDSQVHGTIEQLVAEEHELWERESAGNASESDRQRLQQVKVSLDQCGDLLRPRRALRDAGRGPEDADARRPEGVAAHFRKLAEGLDTAIVRVVAARPGIEATRAVIEACQPALVPA